MSDKSQIFAVILYLLIGLWVILKIMNTTAIKKMNCKEKYQELKKVCKNKKNAKILFKAIVLCLSIFGIYLALGIGLSILYIILTFSFVGMEMPDLYNNLAAILQVYFQPLQYILSYIYILIYMVLIRVIYVNILLYKELKEMFCKFLENEEKIKNA